MILKMTFTTSIVRMATMNADEETCSTVSLSVSTITTAGNTWILSYSRNFRQLKLFLGSTEIGCKDRRMHIAHHQVLGECGRIGQEEGDRIKIYPPDRFSDLSKPPKFVRIITCTSSTIMACLTSVPKLAPFPSRPAPRTRPRPRPASPAPHTLCKGF
jgi:hypothetical protein